LVVVFCAAPSAAVAEIKRQPELPAIPEVEASGAVGRLETHDDREHAQAHPGREKGNSS
jgi:hypothetical protein